MKHMHKDWRIDRAISLATQGATLSEAAPYVGMSACGLRALLIRTRKLARFYARNRIAKRKANAKGHWKELRGPSQSACREVLRYFRRAGYRVTIGATISACRIEGVPISISQPQKPRKEGRFKGHFEVISRRCGTLRIVILPNGNRWYFLPDPNAKSQTFRISADAHRGGPVPGRETLKQLGESWRIHTLRSKLSPAMPIRTTHG